MDNINFSPWEIPVQERESIFRNAKASGKHTVLFVYETPDSGTFRYRGYNIFSHLKESQRWSMVYFFSEGEMDFINRLLPECDLLVLGRERWTHFLDLTVHKAKALGKPVLFDLDDLVFDIQYIPLLTNSLAIASDTYEHREKNYSYWFSYVGRVALMASRADGFITTNDFLGNMVTNTFNKPAVSIRNSLNCEQLKVSATVAEKKTDKDRPFTIGYFSGSPTHVNDFAVIAPELKLFLEQHPEAQLLIVGHLEFPAYMKPFLDNGQIVFHYPVDFLTLQKLVADVDVNIVPLLINDFTNCKSELKYFEAAVTKTITVASPTYAYKNAITHGENGFLCLPGEWLAILQNIYDQRIDRNSIVNNAYRHALETYYGKTMLAEIEYCYDSFLK